MSDFLRNKSAIILAFDEFVGLNTSLNGNSKYIAIEEFKQMITFFLDDNIFY